LSLTFNLKLNHFQATKLTPSPAKKKERSLNSYFPTVKPHNVAAVKVVEDTSMVAAPQVEKNYLRVSETEPIFNEVQTEKDSRQDFIPVSKDKVVEGNQQGLILPSFEDEDFDFNLEPFVETVYPVQRNVEKGADKVFCENDILTLDD
jgi:hypothetical protein